MPNTDIAGFGALTPVSLDGEIRVATNNVSRLESLAITDYRSRTMTQPYMPIWKCGSNEQIVTSRSDSDPP